MTHPGTRIPTHTPTPWRMRPITNGAHSMTRNPSILVIEDDPLYRTLYLARVAKLLPEAQIQSTADGEEALDVLAYSHPDLVILDLHIPKIDGNRLLKLIKCNSQNDSMVILVISAFDEDLTKIGSSGYVNVFGFNKPMRADEFEIVLRQCIALVADRGPTFMPDPDPLIDRSHMRLYIGSEPHVQRDVAERFLDEAKGWTTQLQHHLEHGDHAALAECARNIWAAATTIGAHDAAKLAHRLGFAAQDSSSDLAAILCQHLRAALEAYCAALAGAFVTDRAPRC